MVTSHEQWPPRLGGAWSETCKITKTKGQDGHKSSKRATMQGNARLLLARRCARYARTGGERRPLFNNMQLAVAR
jgi:hypothetical protein